MLTSKSQQKEMRGTGAFLKPVPVAGGTVQGSSLGHTPAFHKPLPSQLAQAK